MLVYYTTPQWGDLGLHQNCLQNATPWSIRLVRAIPKSVQQLFGLDKRLARAEIVAIKRECRTSRATKSKMAHVVQVLFPCFGITNWRAAAL